MSDQISRADAIKAVEQEYRIDRGYMVDDYTYGFNQAIHYVSDIILPDLPSAETHEIRTETHACVKETHDTDLISRADAIEAVLTYFIPRSHTGERGEHEEDFVRTIFKALPSAEADWIPCSERLPKRDELVLVTYKTTDRIHLCKYIDDGSENPWWSYIDDCCAWNNVVLAWMPLPKPYRGDGEA